MLDPGPKFISQLGQRDLEALIETMYLVAFADGCYSPAERDQFCACVEELSRGRLQASDFEPLLTSLSARLARGERDAVLQSIAAQLPGDKLRSVAMILACDMAAADGVLHPTERELLLQLATTLRIDEGDVRAIIDSMPTAAAANAPSVGLD